MSTHSTLVHGKDFNLYEELFERTPSVWLTLDGCVFEATERGVKVEIPLAVWEVIRHRTPARFDLASLSAAHLRAEAKKRVEATRSDYRTSLGPHRAAGKARGGIHRPLPFAHSNREAHLPRAKHLAAVLVHLRRERAAQRNLQRQIARLTAPRPQSRSSVSTSSPTPASSRL